MKSLLVIAVVLFAGAAQAADVKLEGLYNSNAGALTESLLVNAKNDASIQIDTSIYTVTKVSRADGSSSIECVRHHFGGTPAQYQCVISQK